MAKKRVELDALERAHFARVERFTRLIDSVYEKAVKELAQLAKRVDFDPDKPFSFKNYPKAAKEAEKAYSILADNITATIQKGNESEWMEANRNNDELLERLLSSSRVGRKRLEAYKSRNIEALESFQNRKVGGLKLSDRVWNLTNQFSQEIELGIDVGLGEGKSAQELSRDLRSYLNNPDKLFRRVRDSRGQLHLSRAAASYSPGQGVYRSSYKNAMRLTRTEINMAYRESDYHRWQEMDFIVGFEVKLSNNPHHCPMCEALQGKYPKDFKFTGWHPHCRCRAIPLFSSDESFDLNLKSILEGNNPVTPESEMIRTMPAGYVNWMKQNEDRLIGARSTPYFIRDNYKAGDLKKGLRFKVVESAVTTKPSKKQIDLKDFIKKDIPTNKEINELILHYADLNPDEFYLGLESVSIRHSKSYFMQQSRVSNRITNEWISKSKISVSSRTFEKSNFNPAKELKEALGAIKRGVELTFDQEYSIESLWHEILHAKSKTPPRSLTIIQNQAMETVNQFIARHTYDEFLEKLGGKAIHKQQILEEGYGYNQWVSSFRERLKIAGIDEQTAIDELMPILMSDYRLVLSEISNFFKRHNKN